MRSVRIKICGITRVEDAGAAVALGADFIGLNFWEQSSRRIDPLRARAIAEAVRGRTSVVGVFVNPAPEQIEEALAFVGLDLLQFHGDERPSDLEPWTERAVKALRFDGALDSEAVDGYGNVWGFLVEPRRASYGGTGESWDYSLPEEWPRDKPVLVAGGLDPDNVAAAVRASNPWGVDVCSGVESSPGIKDPVALRQFFAEVDRAAS